MTISLPQLPYDPSPTEFYSGPNHLVELTQSAITTYLRCPQKFVFRYMMRLQNRGLSIPLLIGSAVHAGLEVLLDPANELPIEHPNTLAKCVAACDKVFEDLEEHPEKTLGREDKVNHARAVAHACVEGWWITHSTTVADWKLLRTEMNVRSAPDATLGTDLVHRLAGKLDAIVEVNSRPWLLEHKTRSNLFGLDVVGLELDFQTMFYLILCHMQSQKDPTVPVPDGFIYDAIQKPKHKMSATEGWHGLKERMIAAMSDAPDRYLRMEVVSVTRQTLELMWANLIRIVTAMDRLSPDTVYRNQTACNDYGGCPYRNLCFAGADVGNPEAVLNLPGLEQFELITDLHAELGSESDQGSED